MVAKRKSDKVVKVAFRQRMEGIKDDIAAGRITFYNPPQWTDKLLNITAMNCTLLLLAKEAKWN